MMTTRTLSVTAGLGGENPDLPNGNIVATTTATELAGAWLVTDTTWDTEGTPTSATRAATVDELLALDPPPEPEPNPAVTALLVSLTQEQRDALALALAAFPGA
jgi:hypothetical protein